MKISLRFAFAFGVSTLVPLMAAAADPAAAYTAWRGGTAYLALQRMTEQGVFSDGGLSGPGTLAADAAGDTRQDWRFGTLQTILTLHAGQGFYTNLSAQRLPLSAAEAVYAAADAKTLLASAFASGVVQVPDQRIDGGVWHVLRVRPGNGETEDFLIAPTDGALHGILIQRNGAAETLRFADWRMVDGVRLPFDVRAAGVGGIGVTADDVTDFKIASVAMNKIPVAGFAPPPSKSLAQYADGASSGWIPFDFDEKLIYLTITVNGHRARALLDSGAGTTVLDTNYATSIGLRAQGGFSVLGQGGSAGSAYAAGLDIGAGGLTLHDVTATLIDLRPVGQYMTRPLLIVMGAEAFSECAVEIDYARRRLRFSKPPGVPAAGAPAAAPLWTDGGGFITEVSPEGRPPIPVILDTGDNGAFQLFPTYWKRLDLLAGRPASAVRSGGVGGLFDTPFASLNTLSVGGVTLRDVPASFDTPGQAVSDQTDILGNLGNETLSHLHVTFDFPDGRLILRQAAQTGLPFSRDMVGLELVADGAKRKVVFVMPGSPAAAAGLRAGDVIVSVQGYALGPASAPAWQQARPGQRITLKLASGRHITVVERRFY